MKKWNRFLSLALAGALALSLTACGGGNDDPSGGGNDPAGGGEVFEILYAGTSPDTHAMMIAINAVAEEMREESGGRLNMSVFPNNQLGDSRANLESMQTNTIQAGELSTAPLAYFTDLYQPLSLPFFFASAEEGYAFLESDFAQELADKCAEECGFRPVAWFLNGQRALTNSVRAVSSPADMAGLKIRVMENEIYIRTFEALGASPTPMSFAEVFTALQQKTVDGQDNPYALTVSNNFY